MIWKIPRLTEGSQKYSNKLIGVFKARKGVVEERTTKTALAVSISIGENGGFSNDMFFVDQDEKAESAPSAKATLRKGFARTGDKNALREAAARRVPAERDVRQ